MQKKPFLKSLALGLVAITGLAVTVGATAAGGGPVPKAVTGESVDPDFQRGMDAIKAKAWGAAVTALEQVAARQPDNAEIFNEMGYAERNRGNLDAAFRDYDRALALNPRHRGAHEYVGEAYLLAGNLDKAEEQLAALDKLCRMPCEEYHDLKVAITDYKKSHAK
jgi:tetratricopeptide (TPR) repeat protein